MIKYKEMKKFIVVESGKEVKLGDKIILMFETNTPFGFMKVSKVVPVTEIVLMRLIADKKVKVVDTDDIANNTEHNDIWNDTTWNNTLINLSKKTGWKLDKLNGILGTIESVNPWAALQIVLKEIAIELDKKYKDHINKSEEIYAVSPQDGKIHKINKKTIKNYRAFPAFRNVEDAKIACSLVREHLKSIFANA